MMRRAMHAERLLGAISHRRLCTAGFSNLPLKSELVQALARMGVHAPNAVQSEALPLALRGNDLTICAWTGSGKTLMFLLPILQRLSDLPAGADAPEALVLVPTPELALQVASVAQSLAAPLPEPPTIACVVPEDFTQPDHHPTDQTARLVIATPGALLCRLRDSSLVASALAMVAIDEVRACAWLAYFQGLQSDSLPLTLAPGSTRGRPPGRRAL